MLEGTGHAGCLGLFWGKERDGCLGQHAGAGDSLACCDDDVAVAFGLPGKVDDRVLETVDDLDGDTLFFDTEDFEVCGERFL